MKQRPGSGWVLMLSLSLLLATSKSFSEPVPEETDDPEPQALATAAEPRAKKLFYRGAQAFANKRNYEAITAFKQAQQLVESPLFIFNIALAYQDMGDKARALAAYRDYLRQSPESEDRADVEERMRKLELELAELGLQQLTIGTAPSRAVIWLDGKAVGLSPWTGEVPPGTHKIAAQSPGFRRATAEVVVPSDRSVALSLTLERRIRKTPPELQPQPSAPADADPSSLSRIRPLSWALIGTGLGSLGGSMFFELSRASSKADATGATDPIAAATAQGSADAKHTASMILAGFGAGFVVAGTVLSIVDINRDKTREVQASCTLRFCGMTAKGRF